MRSVLAIFEPERGGVPEHVERLACGLAARGWRVTVAGPPGAAALARMAATPGVDVVALELAHQPHPSDLRAARTLAGIAREHAASVIHGHSTKAGLLAAAASRMTGTPSVYTPHAWVLERACTPATRALYASWERALAHSHRAVIAVAASDRRQALRHRIAAPDAVHVVPNGLPTDPATRHAHSVHTPLSARRELELDADAFVACWVGRNARQKRPQDLPRLGRGLSRAGITLAVLGDGLAGTGRAAAITAAGGAVLAPGTAPATLYAAADVLVSTSAWEGHPLSVLEAMRAGLPVVAYAVGGIPEQVEDLGTGYLVVPGSVDGLVRRVVGLRDDDAGRARIGAAARARFEQCFTLERMLDGVERVYASVSGTAEDTTP